MLRCIGNVPFSVTFTWDSGADAVGAGGPQPVDLRVTVSTGGGASGTCAVTALVVDNMPSCAITQPAPMSSVTTDQDIVFDADHPGGAALDSTFEYSTDAGTTWALATPSTASALANPDLARATPWTGLVFTWDTAVDVPAGMTPQAVTFRITVDDGGGGAGACTVDLTADCLFCGDCNTDGIGPSVIDALAAAQLAAGLGIPSAEQQLCCDVDTSSTITVLDALTIAQVAAGLPATLVCP